MPARAAGLPNHSAAAFKGHIGAVLLKGRRQTVEVGDAEKAGVRRTAEVDDRGQSLPAFAACATATGIPDKFEPPKGDSKRSFQVSLRRNLYCIGFLRRIISIRRQPIFTMSAQVQTVRQRSPVLLSAAVMTPAHRRAAVAVSLLALIVSLATLPFAQTVWWTFPGFILIQQTLLTGNYLIIAALLYGQYSIARTDHLAVLAAAYLVTALLIIVHTLSFPGAVSETGLLAGEPQSTPWLYLGWHAALPLAVIAYASGGLDLYRGRLFDTARIPILLSILSGIASAAVITGFIVAGHEWLPKLGESGRLLPTSRAAVATLLIFQLGALLVLVKKTPRSVLDVWLMVTMFVLCCTVSLSQLISAQRFDMGWYIGRIFDVLTSVFILLLLLSETVILYGRSALAAAAEHRERERRLRETEAILTHLSRVNELGQNVSSLIHEIRQPLTAISNYAAASIELAKDVKSEGLQNVLHRLAEQSSRATEIIRHLQDFVARGEPESQVVHIPNVEIRCGSDAVSGFFDRVEIEQVVFNLVRNAVEAMAGNERSALTISTKLTSDNMIEVSVADTGPGVSADIRARLFDPFVTTKKSGLGIGLSVCRVIIEAHGGTLSVDHNPHGGAIFHFTVPHVPRTPPPQGTKPFQ
jgi:two-component system sensor histidine kinase/response regulator